MSGILEKIAARARERVAADKERVSLDAVRELAFRRGAAEREDAVRESAADGGAFRDALKKPGLSVICEVKRASPSKGLIAPEFPYVAIAREYESAGADAVSCLTEPEWFLGSDAIFREIRAEIKIPMLRKDFTVDEYQIYQAKVMGANAVLLICALLDTDTLRRYLSVCADLGLAALAEAHDEREIRSAVSAGAEIIGVNNRNLKDFSVDFSNAARLRDKIPPECVYVAESGVTRPADAAALRRIGADAVLVGEALMRSGNKRKFLADMRAAADGASLSVRQATDGAFLSARQATDGASLYARQAADGVSLSVRRAAEAAQ